MQDLMKRWADWSSGSAEEATNEINRVIGDDPISLRTFHNYVSKRIVSRDSSRSDYGRRQLLEVMATRTLLKTGQAKIEAIAQALPAFDDAKLAEIATAEPVQPEPPAVALVRQLQGEIALQPAASTILRSAQPRGRGADHPMVSSLAGARRMFATPQVVSTFIAREPSPLGLVEDATLGSFEAPAPAEPQPRLSWRDGSLELSLDPSTAETEEQLRERASRLIDIAISAIRPR